MRCVAITGIGLLSGSGADAEAHWRHLSNGMGSPAVSRGFCQIHPLGEIDFSVQIPKKSDLRQMEPWQRIGVYAAGLALADAGIAHVPKVLDRTNLIVSAGSGERDTTTDVKVLETIAARGHGEVRPNEILPSNLRPTLFLAQLSNLLAGNISIVHNVTGSSRTFMGEESAGFAAVDTAVRRIKAGQGDIFLVGGAFNADRPDILLNFALGRMLLEGEFAPVWSRRERQSGFAPASIGAFLVLEDLEHARARAAKPYGRLLDVCTDRCNRQRGAVAASLEQLIKPLKATWDGIPMLVLSGASGVEQPTREEQLFLESLVQDDVASCYRAYGSVLGHGIEAHFTSGIALAALALRHGKLYAPFESTEGQAPPAPPQQILVTGVGHWRGEALAMLEAI